MKLTVPEMFAALALDAHQHASQQRSERLYVHFWCPCRFGRSCMLCGVISTSSARPYPQPCRGFTRPKD